MAPQLQVIAASLTLAAIEIDARLAAHYLSVPAAGAITPLFQ